MKKLMTAAVMLTAIVCANANAASVPTHKVTQAQTTEGGSLWVDYYSDKITGSEYEKRLNPCSDSGNLVCSYILGEHYYDTKEYRKAYPLLMKSRGLIEYPNGGFLAPSETYLGDMFRFGFGVMQNNDKAIEHYKIGATLGDKDCAMGMASSYARKALGDKTGSPAYESAVKNVYAWSKVAQGLGEESYTDTDGNPQTLSYRVTHYRKSMVTIYGESFANDADNRASEICSTITDCIQ